MSLRGSMRNSVSRGDGTARDTRLGPGTGLWHQIPAGDENLRVHRRFFKDIDSPTPR